LEKAKIEEELLSIFKFFYSSFQLLVNVKKNIVLQRKGMKIATFLPIAARQFCLLSYWLTAGIWVFPSGFPIPFKNCPETSQ
jgi:hypothetical protein